MSCIMQLTIKNFGKCNILSDCRTAACGSAACRAAIISLMLLFSALYPLSAQSVSVNPLTNQPYFNSEFQKQQSTWNWYFQFELNNRPGSVWEWNVREQFRSNLLVPNALSKLWKDEHNFRGTFYRNIAAVKLGLYADSWLQNDEQVSTKNTYANHALGLTARYGTPGFSLDPYIGYQQLQTRSKTEWGWDVGLRGRISRFELGNYTSDIEAHSDYDFYRNLRNYENSFQFRTMTRFNRYTHDSLAVIFSEINKENYTADLSGISRARINHRELKNQLFYNISSANRLALLTRLMSRNLAYVSVRDIVYIENQLRYLYLGGQTQLQAYLRTNDETQDITGTITDSRTRETAIGFQITRKFSSKKSLYGDFSYVKLQYDTPDERNKDDRDEQRFIFTLRYRQQLSPVLTMEWLGYAYLFHQIYIFKERSSANNWNRVYKLSPKIHYRHDRLSNTLTTQVLANYTVYDFEAPEQTPRSFIFRKYILSDSLTFRYFAANYAGFFVRLELEDKGTFYKELFAQRVVQSYESQFFNVFLLNKRFYKFNLRLGYTYYLRREWRHIPIKKQSREITNQGPYISLTYAGSRRLIFFTSIALAHLNDSISSSSTYVTGYLKMYYTI
ncbi:MAG TPA: hypothetical protein ENK44_11375 [Caldithrix abyssi]|uniref:Uncharacterized protein n=1 Tax=Caldithrix abyssi TaxID=187145 RepID=A0A7V4WVW6_CALAY|nr:hypothetical protein [Caldithrix abyssi]